MKIIEKKVNIDAAAPAGYLFIDIETTGLAKESTNIYLIGIAHYVCEANVCVANAPGALDGAGGPDTADGQNAAGGPDAASFWLFKQWLIESPVEEAEALSQVADYTKSFDTLVHYNGDHFDLPYLDYHARLADVPSPYLTMKSLDIFKKIRACKSLFYLDSARQKSFEVIVGNDRRDKFGGGELINVYYDYLASLNNSNGAACDEEKLSFLLLHNEEDVLGMATLINLLPYGTLYDYSKKITCDVPKVISQKGDELLLQFTTRENFKYKITRPYCDYHLIIEGNTLSVKIPLVNAEMRYFFPHPEDYYYLPKEDIIVHKSVGASVDPAFREKARKENCYAKKRGAFIRIYSTKYAPVYKYTYWSLPHTLVDDKLLGDVEFWNHFLFDILDEIKKDCYLL